MKLEILAVEGSLTITDLSHGDRRVLLSWLDPEWVVNTEEE